MHHVTKIIFITLVLSVVSPVFVIASETQLAAADSQCRGAACATSASIAKTTTERLADYSPSPSQLLLAGIALLAIRIVAKKLLAPKAESAPIIH